MPNGRILGYHIYVHNVAANLTEVKKYQSSASLSSIQHHMDFSINNLSECFVLTSNGTFHDGNYSFQNHTLSTKYG